MMWDPPLFAGDSKLQVIVRNDHGNQVRIWAGDKLFDQFICTYAAEIPKGKKAYFDVINQCETWKTPEAAEEYPRELEEYQKSQEQINEPQNHNQ